MATIRTSLLDEARGLLDETIELRRRIHRYPEIGLTLPRTQQVVLDALAPLGLDVRTGSKTTSVTATLEGARPGPTMLLRADMDALPLQEETPGRRHARRRRPGFLERPLTAAPPRGHGVFSARDRSWAPMLLLEPFNPRAGGHQVVAGSLHGVEVSRRNRAAFSHMSFRMASSPST